MPPPSTHIRLLPVMSTLPPSLALSQVREYLRVSAAVRFGQLCAQVGGAGREEEVVRACEGCGVLVQGCWCAKSEVVYPQGDSRAVARDYVVREGGRSVCADENSFSAVMVLLSRQGHH